MKTKLTLLFFICCTALLSAQTWSEKTDSLTRNYVRKIPAPQRAIFRQLVAQQKTYATAQRIDSAQYDYALLISSVKPGDSAAIVAEYYYRTSDRQQFVSMHSRPPVKAVLPRRYVGNGKDFTTPPGFFGSSIMNIHFYDLHEMYYTLDTVLHHFGNLKPVQEILYDPSLANMSDSSAVRLQELAALEQARLKTTYQLVTFINNIDKKVTVSLQTPAAKPEVRFRFVKFNYMSW